MTQVHLLISGFVQGVGYREFVRSKARKLGLTGWVRNLSDNRVEVIAQSNEKTLKRFIKICERGPFLAQIKNIAVEWQDSHEQFDTFEKRSTD